MVVSRPRGIEGARLLGPGPLEPQMEHADGFVAVWNSLRGEAPLRYLDLGSGGGLPGLLLLEAWSTRGVLMDAMQKRTAFLREALAWSGAPTNGTIVTARAEDLARDPDFDGQFDLVTARSFGPPSVTAECAIRFLRRDGLLIVSEPPDRDGWEERWPADALRVLGLRPVQRFHTPFTFQALEKFADTDEQFPRRSGTPGKRPLFG